MKRHIQMLIATAVVFSAGIVWNSDGPKVKPLTQKETKIATVLIKHGSDNPVELAKEIAKSKRPRLATAVTITESNGRNVRTVNPWENSKGYFQIQEDLHGAFADDIPAQVREFEEVMEEMIRKSDGNLRKALSRYNGDKSGKYHAKVMSRVAEVKL